MSLFYEERFILSYICVLILFNSFCSQKRIKKLSVPVLQTMPMLETSPLPVPASAPQPVPFSEPMTASIAVQKVYDINIFRRTTLSDW